MSKIVKSNNKMSKMVKIDREKLNWDKKEKQKQQKKKEFVKRMKTTFLDWNFELGDNKSNKFMTITCVIKKWEQEYNRETDKTDKEKVCALFDDFENFWNNGYELGKTVINFMDFIAEWLIKNAIEELYEEANVDGDNVSKTLANKLDFIYYKQAESEFIKTLDKYELDMDYWGQCV